MASKKLPVYREQRPGKSDELESIDSEFDEFSDEEEVLHAPQISDYKTLEPQSGLEPYSYAGKGPKNYIRPDDAVLDDVVDLLTRHQEIDATEVDVHVEKGEVILTGSVPEERSKLLAAEVIKLVPGVKKVSNRLRVLQTTNKDRSVESRA
jgi:osmotically-inducible protein OsmY